MEETFSLSSNFFKCNFNVKKVKKLCRTEKKVV